MTLRCCQVNVLRIAKLWANRPNTVWDVLLPLFFFCVIVSGCEEKPPGFYEHEDDGFSFVLPDGWNIQEDPPGASVVAWRGERDEKSPTVTVVTVDVLVKTTNADFTELNFRDAAATRGYYFLRDEPIVVDGDTLTSRVYIYPSGDQYRQAILVSLLSDQSDEARGYVLLCSSASEKYQGDREEYLKILNSFRRE